MAHWERKKAGPLLLAGILCLGLLGCAEKQEAPTPTQAATAAVPETTAETQDPRELVLQSKYEIALGLLQDRQYAAAEKLFGELGQYADAGQRVMECRYAQAEQCYAEGDYAQAMARYAELGDYQQSSKMVSICKFQVADQYFANGEYDKALPLYRELGEFEDAAQQAAACQQKIDAQSSTDQPFLQALEASVLDRMAATSGPFWDAEQLVAKEKAYLDPYVGAAFSDPALQNLAETYLEGLDIQDKSNQLANDCDSQYEWQRGMLLRYKALCGLYQQYGFLSDNMDFVATYVNQLDREQYKFDGYNTIRKDLFTQMGQEGFLWDKNEGAGTLSCTLRNNTQYTYDILFELEYVDRGGVMFATDSAPATDIRPGMAFTVTAWPDDLRRVDIINSWLYFMEVR